MSSTSTITFTLDGDVKTFQILAKDAESLKKVLDTSATEAQKLSQRLLDMNQAAEAFRGMETLVRGIESAFGSWSTEFNETNANETRLAQSMRNAMCATREQANAIVELTDAQEGLGIDNRMPEIAEAHVVELVDFAAEWLTATELHFDQQIDERSGERRWLHIGIRNLKGKQRRAMKLYKDGKYTKI